MLDRKIEEKAEMKKILNDEQYDKWVKSLEKKDHRRDGKKDRSKKNTRK